MRFFGKILRKTFLQWIGGTVFTRAGALAYTGLFSLGPTLLIMIGVASMLFGKKAAQSWVFSEMERFMGSEAAKAVLGLIKSASLNHHDLWATIIGGFLFLMSSTAVFSQIKGGLNDIWSVGHHPEVNGVWRWCKNRLMAFVVLIVFSLLFILVFVLSTLLTALTKTVATYFAIRVSTLYYSNYLLLFVMMNLSVGIILKALPDVRLLWKDVLMGGLVTSLLLMVGKFLIALYITNRHVTNVYGATGSLVVLLLWIYYSSAIFYLGAVFVKVFAEERGHLVRLAPDAVWVRKHIPVNEVS